MPTDRLETAAHCLRRLGPPPAVVAQRWLEDARSQVDSFAADQFDPVDPIWQSLRVNENGRLIPAPVRLRRTPAGARAPRRAANKRILSGGITILLLIGATISWVRVTGSAKSVSQPQPRVSPRASASAPEQPDPFSPGFVEASGSEREPPRARSPSSTAHAERVASQDSPLETLAGEPESADDIVAVDTEPFAGNLSLGSLMPAADAVPTTDQGQLPVSAPEQTAEIDIAELDSDDEPIANATARETTAATPLESKTTAVAIPRPPATTASEIPAPILVLRAPQAPARLHLEFPEATPLSLRADPQQQTWQVFTPTAAAPIAELRWQADETEEGTTGLQFRWLPEAALSGDAVSLSHGRLASEAGDIVYLRAQLDAEPIALSFADKDEKLKWSLGAPIENAVTQLSLAIEVPDDVELQWIEPIDVSSPRRTRGIATLTLRDSPAASALVLRIDLRTTTTFSMRVRLGGRLDPQLPWQWTDAQTIRRSLSAVTAELQFADEKMLRLDAAISQAKKQRARRREASLELQRDQIDEAVKTATVMAKRLAELDQLVALLDAGGRITASLNVQWPTGQTQTLLDLHAVP